MKCLICHLAGSLLASFVLFILSSANSSAVYATECLYENDLHISLNKNIAQITNTSSTCSYKVTIAAYDMPVAQGEPNWLEAQKLLNYRTKTFSPGETDTISADDSASQYCRIQVDLFRGDTVLEPPYYVNNLADQIYTKDTCGATTSPAPSSNPTATPVATPTPSPVNTPAPTVTPTPSVTPTPVPVVTTSTPGGDGLGCAVRDCSGNPIGGPSVPSVLGTTTPPVLPVTGVDGWMALQAFGAAMLGAMGIMIKKYVKNIQ